MSFCSAILEYREISSLPWEPVTCSSAGREFISRLAEEGQPAYPTPDIYEKHSKPLKTAVGCEEKGVDGP